jgi:tetratricopeptide (TPR) repeat protein
VSGKAIELDANLAEAHQALGATRLWQLWDWEGAGNAFERAFELNPNLGGVMGGEYVWYLMVMGRHEESIAVMERFLTLDPLSYITRMTAFHVYYRAGQYVKAVDICRRSIRLRPEDARLYHDLAAVLTRQGRDDDAHQARVEAIRLSGTPSGEIERFDSLYRHLGPEAYPRWLQLQAEGQPLESAYGLVFAAWIHASLHEPERALEYLEMAYEARDGQLVNLNTDPQWDMIRQEPRFQDLVERMRFPG